MSFDLKVHGLNGRSYRLINDNLEKDIVPSQSKITVKKNKIVITLQKVFPLMFYKIDICMVCLSVCLSVCCMYKFVCVLCMFYSMCIMLIFTCSGERRVLLRAVDTADVQEDEGAAAGEGLERQGPGGGDHGHDEGDVSGGGGGGGGCYTWRRV